MPEDVAGGNRFWSGEKGRLHLEIVTYLFLNLVNVRQHVYDPVVPWVFAVALQPAKPPDVRLRVAHSSITWPIKFGLRCTYLTHLQHISLVRQEDSDFNPVFHRFRPLSQ